MSEMVRRFLHQRFGNPGLVLGLAAIGILTMISLMSGRGGTAFLALLLLTPGVISRDVSSGTAQMILARPIRRSDYVLGRYLGVLVSYVVFLGVALLLALIARPFFSTFFGSRSAIGVGEMMGVAGSDWLEGALFAATLLFFSTFLPGFGDLLAYFLLQIGLTVMQGLGRQYPWLGRFATITRANVFPDVDWSAVFRGDGAFSASTGRFVLALSVFLIGALFIFSRREFSYGQD
jgi:ABC-2 family transporter